MGLNSEPLPENEALLRLIDAGIHALEQGEDTPFEPVSYTHLTLPTICSV